MKASSLIFGVAYDAHQLDRELYRPDSQHWHTSMPSDDSTCQICFAGVWLARYFDHTKIVHFGNMTETQANTCVFLDRLRMRLFDGIRHYALQAGIDEPQRLETVLEWIHKHVQRFSVHVHNPVTSRFSNWREFDEYLVQMKELAQALEARNL